METAAEYGHENIVQLMLDQYADNYNCNRVMTEATRRGHENIVRLLLDQGANDFNWAMLPYIQQ